MEDNKVNEQADEQQSNTVIEFQGGKYDIATPEGRAGFEAAKNTFNNLFGKQAQEVGSLRKEVPYLKKLGAAGTSHSAQSFLTINKLVENGDMENAFKLMADQYQRREQELESARVEADFKRRYEQARPDVFEVLEADLAWDHIFSNYRDDLYAAENPIELVDAVLIPKANKLKEKFKPAKTNDKDDKDIYVTPGKGRTEPVVSKVVKKADDKEDSLDTTSIIARLGHKK